MVKPHAKTATALAPRTIENGIMRGAGRAALEKAPSFSELNVPVFAQNVYLMFLELETYEIDPLNIF